MKHLQRLQFLSPRCRLFSLFFHHVVDAFGLSLHAQNALDGPVKGQAAEHEDKAGNDEEREPEASD